MKTKTPLVTACFIGMGVATVLMLGPSRCSANDLTTAVEVPALNDFGGFNNGLPFGVQQPNRYQQIYSAASFPRGGLLDRIRFRTGPALTPIPDSVEVELTLSVSHAARPVLNASQVFTENIGPDVVELLSGPATIVVSERDGLSFNVEIDVPDLFVYNPARGDFLLDLSIPQPPTADSFVLDLSGGGQQDVTQRIFTGIAGNINDLTGTVGANSGNATPAGLVTQFVFLVPEPTTGALFPVSLLAASAPAGRLRPHRR